ncbi:unnamed protein product [Paramecium octaurelia]|uniref:Uncharacterized protein n=1 Tax=Paramecium octaurelia TaxID=43137 RepID=A0A8S1YIJ2_PAROT|nr:unnamed protein product [Paramecium octaurelia]
MDRIIHQLLGVTKLNIIFSEYLNGTKIGEWEIQHNEYFDEEFKQIGQGVYDKKGQKVSQWTEQHQSAFQRRLQSKICWGLQKWQKIWKLENISLFKIYEYILIKIQSGVGYYEEDGKKMDNGLSCIRISQSIFYIYWNLYQ